MQHPQHEELTVNQSVPADVQLPAAVQTYLDAHDRNEVDAALSTFTPDARVFDEHHEYRGTEQIRAWLAAAGAQWTYTRTLTGTERLDDTTWLVHNHLEGDFPGGGVDLRFRFALTDGRIADLAIAP